MFLPHHLWLHPAPVPQEEAEEEEAEVTAEG